MNRIGIIIGAIAIGLCASASTCQKPTPTNPVVAGVINCAEEGVQSAAIHLIDDVASALATGDYVSGLVALVKQFGEAAVDCAVREVADTAGAHAKMNQLEADKAQRAKAWLDSRSVTFSSARPPQHLAGFCPPPFRCAPPII